MKAKMMMSEYVPIVLGVPVHRAIGDMPAWHVEWWQQEQGPCMVVGCTAESADELMRVLRADPTQYRLVGAYDIAERTDDWRWEDDA